MKRRLEFTIDQDGFLDGINRHQFNASLMMTVGCSDRRRLTPKNTRAMLDRFGTFVVFATDRPRVHEDETWKAGLHGFREPREP